MVALLECVNEQVAFRKGSSQRNTKALILVVKATRYFVTAPKTLAARSTFGVHQSASLMATSKKFSTTWWEKKCEEIQQDVLKKHHLLRRHRINPNEPRHNVRAAYLERDYLIAFDQALIEAAQLTAPQLKMIEILTDDRVHALKGTSSNHSDYVVVCRKGTVLRRLYPPTISRKIVEALRRKGILFIRYGRAHLTVTPGRLFKEAFIRIRDENWEEPDKLVQDIVAAMREAILKLAEIYLVDDNVVRNVRLDGFLYLQSVQSGKTATEIPRPISNLFAQIRTLAESCARITTMISHLVAEEILGEVNIGNLWSPTSGKPDDMNSTAWAIFCSIVMSLGPEFKSEDTVIRSLFDYERYLLTGDGWPEVATCKKHNVKQSQKRSQKQIAPPEPDERDSSPKPIALKPPKVISHLLELSERIMGPLASGIDRAELLIREGKRDMAKSRLSQLALFTAHEAPRQQILLYNLFVDRVVKVYEKYSKKGRPAPPEFVDTWSVFWEEYRAACMLKGELVIATKEWRDVLRTITQGPMPE